MKAPIRSLALLFGSLLLAAGSDRVHAGVYGPPAPDKMNVSVSASSIGTNSTATVTVSVTRPNGTSEADGTVISATVSPPTIGTLSGAGAGGGGSVGNAALVGGVATFVFQAGANPGIATITFALPPVNGHPNAVTQAVKIAVVEQIADTVTISASSNSAYPGSTATLKVTVTRPDGTPEADGTLISGAVVPALGSVEGVGIGGPNGSVSSPLIGGVATFIFTAGPNPGITTVTFSVPAVAGHSDTTTQSIQMTVADAPSDTINVNISSSVVSINSTATLTVTVNRRDGTPESDGTVISATVSPPTLGTIASVGTSGSASGSSPLVGGVATFVFVANNTTGTATVTLSLPPANGYPNTIIKQVPITVVQGSGNNPSLLISPSTVTLPQNLVGVGPYIGSPYMAELTVQWRGLITGQLLNGKINVATAPVGSIAFSMLDDPTTPWTGETKTPPTAEGNEFLTELGSGTVNVTAGIGTIFVHSQATTGPATLTITAVDPETNRTISSQVVVNVITPPGANLPTSITLSQAANGLYVNNSNGPQSKLVTATVNNIYGTPAIAAPGVDNVSFEIVGPSGTDARLFAIAANGVSQLASWVKTDTGPDGANVFLIAGNTQGPVQIRATVDAFDGDVGNGVTIPITATTTVVVSDGQLYSLTLTSPMANAIAVNGITPSGGSTSTVNGVTLPLQPDATYSLTVSALAKDRGGNPVLPGTQIKFGLIDGPQNPNFAVTCAGLQAFQICGNQGNPQPGGLYFIAPDGQFKTAGGNAGPGDTLVVFGKQEHGAPAGNDDLESALQISQIFSGTQLFTQFPFNRNDTTGVSMLPGPLPYVIGRATMGNINSPVTTDSSGAATITGTATTKLNYPVSRLNRSVVIWAQGTGPDTAYLDTHGNPTMRLVTDAIVTTYPAVADLIVSASPNPIPGNGTVPVTVCVTDALQIPIPNLRFNFSFSNLGAGSGKVDGTGTTGWTQYATDGSGCVVAQVYTNGIASTSGGGSGSSGAPTLTFTAPGYAPGSSASVAIPITAGGDLVLLVSPSALGGSGGSVTFTLLTSNGNPVPGVQLTGSCTGDTVSLSAGPGTTGSDGKTSATINANLDAYGTPGSGTCTFKTASGSPTATVNLKGANLCLTQPSNAACTTSGGGTGGGSGNTLTINVDAANFASIAKVTLGGTTQFSPSNPACQAAANGQKTCTYTIAQSVQSVTLAASPSANVTWSDDCSGSTGSPISVLISGSVTCTATFQ